MTEDCYRQVAALHAQCIGQGFLATLGIPFLAQMYRAIDQADGSVLLVERRNGQIMGFVSGGVGMRAIYRRMLRSPFRLGWSLLPVLFKPRSLARIAEILRYGRGRPPMAAFPEAELLSIAVAPDLRGSGVAESLYRRLVVHFKEQGVLAFKITVGDALAPAHRFYLRMGAVPAGKVEVHAGDASTVYVHDCACEGIRYGQDSNVNPAIT